MAKKYYVSRWGLINTVEHNSDADPFVYRVTHRNKSAFRYEKDRLFPSQLSAAQFLLKEKREFLQFGKDKGCWSLKAIEELIEKLEAKDIKA